MPALKHLHGLTDEFCDETLFAKIAHDIREDGYSINPCALPPYLQAVLGDHLAVMDDHKFDLAAIGRDKGNIKNRFVRRDSICWITGEATAGRLWLDWARRLKMYLNQRLFLGLFDFESHFSYYASGAFYKRHVDASRGDSNRVLTIFAYLNHDWTVEDAGELVLYCSEDDQQGIRVTPAMGTLVVFLSKEFPYEVLPANRDRYSIAGWYRINSSTTDRLDLPL